MFATICLVIAVVWLFAALGRGATPHGERLPWTRWTATGPVRQRRPRRSATARAQRTQPDDAAQAHSIPRLITPSRGVRSRVARTEIRPARPRSRVCGKPVAPAVHKSATSARVPMSSRPIRCTSAAHLRSSTATTPTSPMRHSVSTSTPIRGRTTHSTSDRHHSGQLNRRNPWLLLTHAVAVAAGRPDRRSLPDAATTCEASAEHDIVLLELDAIHIDDTPNLNAVTDLTARRRGPGPMNRLLGAAKAATAPEHPSLGRTDRETPFGDGRRPRPGLVTSAYSVPVADRPADQPGDDPARCGQSRWRVHHRSVQVRRRGS